MLPFTEREFLAVFQQYNETVWPIQVILYLIGWTAVGLAWSSRRFASRTVGLLLGGLWLWMGVAYHLWWFSRINPAAYVFAVLFIVQGILFLHAAAQNRLEIHPRFDLFGALGAALIVYALLVYPLLNMLLGHAYPESPTFGLPCPTTIFTFGMLLWTKNLPRRLLVVPALWTLIGGTAVFFLGMWEDLGLLVAGLLAVPLLVGRHSRRERVKEPEGMS